MAKTFTVELPEFKPGEPLYAAKLQALVEAVKEVREALTAEPAPKPATARKATAKAE
jgi:hypothetical protein